MRKPRMRWDRFVTCCPGVQPPALGLHEREEDSTRDGSWPAGLRPAETRRHRRRANRRWRGGAVCRRSDRRRDDRRARRHQVHSPGHCSTRAPRLQWSEDGGPGWGNCGRRREARRRGVADSKFPVGGRVSCRDSAVQRRDPFNLARCRLPSGIERGGPHARHTSQGCAVPP